MIDLQRYTPARQQEWDEFAAASRNGTFLHRRAYMDYHADRFSDHSLMARDGSGRLLAVLPAHAEADGTLASHRGLTYGGWLMAPRHCTAATMIEIFEALAAYMRAQGFRRLLYRPVPHIYHNYPAEDDIYALWRMGATADAINASTTIDLSLPRLLDHGTKNAMNRARRSGAEFGRSDAFEEFWEVLADVLRTRHGARPVHSVEEIRLLASRFPDNIELYTATLDGAVQAGVVIYRTPEVVHAQYTAASPLAREMRLLPALYAHIIDTACDGARYFDFGTSCEQGGRLLNTGLDAQKCGLGGRTTVYPSYILQIP